MKKLNNYEKGFFEGLIDADGCISIYAFQRNDCKGRHKIQVRLSISNNSIGLLNKAKSIIKSKTGYSPKFQKKKGGGNWSISDTIKEYLKMKGNN